MQTKRGQAVSDGEVLAGGNSQPGVVRIGSTVRKPWTDSTPHVVAWMEAVRAAGVDVPYVHGRDEHDRVVTEFVPGIMAIDHGPLGPDDLSRVGAIVRSIHDASVDYRPAGDAVWNSAIPAPGGDLVCHHDLAPWNLVIGGRWVFIDWDSAGPSTRAWDLAYAAQTFTLGDPARPPEAAARDLAAFMHGYDADPELRATVADTMLTRVDAMLHLLRSSHQAGAEPWASMHLAGHGDHWTKVREYVDRHHELWRAALV